MRLVPTPSPEARHVLEAYWEALAAADAPAALRALDQGIVLGESVDRLVRDVVAKAQHEVGRRWQAGEWSISDEHAATAIAEQALAALRAPRRQHHRAVRRVVLACPEGEWHTFPARLAADLAGATGLDVVAAGGSQPAEHLGVFLRKAQPDALALSVTMPVNLVGAWKAIQAAHMLGVPVVAGGAAWGSGSERAERLGADLRVEDPAGLTRAVNLLAAGRPLRPPVSLPPEVEHLASWGDRHGRASETETSLVRAAAAAVACDDPVILDDMRRWLARAPASGGASEGVVHSVCQRLSERLAEKAPLASALLASPPSGASDEVPQARHRATAQVDQ